MEHLTPLDPESTRSAEDGIVEALGMVLEAALDLVVSARAREQAEAIAGLCHDAALLAQALEVVRRTG